MRRFISFSMVSMLWLGAYAWAQPPLRLQASEEVLAADPYMSFDLEDAEAELTRFKKQALQSVSLTAGWLAYASVGLGGNTWAVTRQSGQTDELSTRDIRLTLGIEKRLDGGGRWFAEAGYAVDRRLEYESDQTQRSLGDAAFLTAGWRY